jgi:hypothetical protein
VEIRSQAHSTVGESLRSSFANTLYLFIFLHLFISIFMTGISGMKSFLQSLGLAGSMCVQRHWKYGRCPSLVARSSLVAEVAFPHPQPSGVMVGGLLCEACFPGEVHLQGLRPPFGNVRSANFHRKNVTIFLTPHLNPGLTKVSISI